MQRCKSTVSIISALSNMMQLQQKYRYANQCSNDADRKLLWRHQAARQCVGQHQESAADQSGGRQQKAMIGAECKTTCMRHDQADKSDAACIAHGGSRQ